MEIFCLDEEYINNVIDMGREKRSELFERHKGNPKLDTKEFISIFVFGEMMEDVIFLNKMVGRDDFLPRYADFIIRDVVEQIIEYKYLMKHNDLIKYYLGANIKNLQSSKDVVNNYCNLFSERFPSGSRKTVSQMAKDIDEGWKGSKSKRMTLYGIYKMLSERCHNSYYKSLYDMKDQSETGEKVLALTDDQVEYLKIIIDSFMITYSNI